MTRRYGWGPSDQRVSDLVPHGHWETTTLIHAIDCHGSRASMITNGPTNSWVFEAYVDWLLAPALRPGDVLIMDNLSSHKNPSVLEKIEATGAEVRFLPPYSPDLNPIEHIWDNIRSHSMPWSHLGTYPQAAGVCDPSDMEQYGLAPSSPTDSWYATPGCYGHCS